MRIIRFVSATFPSVIKVYNYMPGLNSWFALKSNTLKSKDLGIAVVTGIVPIDILIVTFALSFGIWLPEGAVGLTAVGEFAMRFFQACDFIVVKRPTQGVCFMLFFYQTPVWSYEHLTL